MCGLHEADCACARECAWVCGLIDACDDSAVQMARAGHGRSGLGLAGPATGQGAGLGRAGCRVSEVRLSLASLERQSVGP